MIDLGTVKPGSTIRIPFSSFDKDDGSAITMTNYAAADLLVYKDGSTTERASTAGFTATTDFDAKTGKHLAILDLADNTTAGFWNAGSEYLVAVDSVTIDAVTTGGWIARFRIGYPGAVLDTTLASLTNQTSFTLTAGPAEDNALTGLWAVIHDIASAVQASWVQISGYTGSTKTVTLAAGATFTVASGDNISVMYPVPLQATTLGRTLDVSATGEAGIDWANIGSPTTAVNLSATNIDVDQVVASVSGAVASVTGNVGGNVTGSVGSVAAGGITASSIAADAITAAKIADGAIDAATFAASAITATAIAADAITAAKIADGAIDAATFAAGAIDAAAIANGAIDRATFAADTGLVSIRSNTAQAGAAGTITLDASASATDDFYNGSVLLLTGGTGVGQSRLIRDYVGATKVASIEPTWTTTPDNTSTFAILPQAYLFGISADDPRTDAIDAALVTIDDFLDTEIAAILADTNELQTDWTNGGRLDLLIDAIKAVTDLLTAAQSEPTAVPAANATPLAKLAFLAALARNKITQTSTEQKLLADDGSTLVATSTHSDDGTTHTKSEWV